MEQIFKPKDRVELLKGWLIHDRKGWKKHAAAARRLERQYRWVGGFSVLLSAVVGASLFAALERGFEPWGRIVAGMISITAAVLSGLLTFNRYEERTEKHRVAAVRYKASLKELEALLSADHPSIDGATIERIEEAFRDLERSAPVVPADIDDDVENQHETFEFVQEAERLGTRTELSRPPSPA
jgi:hypothetical protein